jgi:hypothetical protein
MNSGSVIKRFHVLFLERLQKPSRLYTDTNVYGFIFIAASVIVRVVLAAVVAAAVAVSAMIVVVE